LYRDFFCVCRSSCALADDPRDCEDPRRLARALEDETEHVQWTAGRLHAWLPVELIELLDWAQNIQVSIDARSQKHAICVSDFDEIEIFKNEFYFILFFIFNLLVF
jgi:hypothetical protein